MAPAPGLLTRTGFVPSMPATQMAPVSWSPNATRLPSGDTAGSKICEVADSPLPDGWKARAPEPSGLVITRVPVLPGPVRVKTIEPGAVSKACAGTAASTPAAASSADVAVTAQALARRFIWFPLGVDVRARLCARTL
ncbi:hypothetical protein ACFQ9X_15220 [Catenulispora yoronensis]